MNKNVLMLLLCASIQATSLAQDKVEPKRDKSILPPSLQLTPQKYLPEELADICSRQYMTPKGGLGQIDSDFFIVLSGDKNVIRQPGPTPWTGLPADQRQIVFIFKKAIFEAGKLPADFDLYESTLISFEGVTVRLLEFKNFSGGVCLRTMPGKAKEPKRDK